MRTLRLIGAAIEAEKLRLQARAARTARRIGVALAAGAFGLCALAGLHVIGFLALRPAYPPLPAAAIVFGVDVVLAVVLGLIAARGGESEAEREARAVQQEVLQKLEQTAATVSVLLPLARMVLGARAAGAMTLAGLVGRFLGRR